MRSAHTLSLTSGSTRNSRRWRGCGSERGFATTRSRAAGRPARLPNPSTEGPSSPPTLLSPPRCPASGRSAETAAAAASCAAGGGGAGVDAAPAGGGGPRVRASFRGPRTRAAWPAARPRWLPTGQGRRARPRQRAATAGARPRASSLSVGRARRATRWRQQRQLPWVCSRF